MMHKQTFASVILLVMFFSLISGCNFQVSQDTPTTEAPTSTRTPSPTNTASPTIAPSVTPTQHRSLFEAVLTPEDVPPGFISVPIDELGLSKERLSGVESGVESVFVLIGPETLPMILGYSVSLTTLDAEIAFNETMNQLDAHMMELLTTMEAPDFLEPEQLTDLEGIGDAASGLTVLADTEDDIHMSTVAFRRGSAGAAVYIIYAEDFGARVEVGEMASVLDYRIAEALSLPLPELPASYLRHQVLYNAVLTQPDLPPGFEWIPMSDLDYTLEDLSAEGLEAESAFFLYNSETRELIMGHVVSLFEMQDQSTFEGILDAPEYYISGFVAGMGLPEVLEQRELTPMDEIGEAAVGYRLFIDKQGEPFRIGIVLFQRGFVGAFVHTVYPESSGAIVYVDDVARRLDARIMELLAAND
jgi:hypothetical protein